MNGSGGIDLEALAWKNLTNVLGLTEEVKRQRTVIECVRALHVTGSEEHCTGCGRPFPCPTIKVLEVCGE